MDSNTVHNPVFMVLPPEVAVPESHQSWDHTATAHESTTLFPKLLTTKIKISGVSAIGPNVNSTEGVL